MIVPPSRRYASVLLQIMLMILIAGLALTFLTLAIGRIITGDGQIAFISSRDGDYKIYLIDVQRTLTQKLSDRVVLNCCISWSPDGQQISFMMRVGLNNEIFLLDIATGRIRRITENSGTVQNSVEWSPDNQHILVISADGSDRGLYKIDVTNAERQPFNIHSAYGLTPHWSPDGQHIVFVMGKHGQQANTAIGQGNDTDIYVTDDAGEEARVLTAGDATNLQPGWSPDGTRLAYISIHEKTVQIDVIQTDGDNARQITTSTKQKWGPVWSPDGKEIAFLGNENGLVEIYVVNVESGEERRLTNNKVWEWDTAWSPDGRHLLYVANPEGTFGIYLVNADDGAVRQLTPFNSSYLNTNPIWRP